MRILLVHPGAEFSLTEVYDGYARGFRKAGVEVIPYRMDGRIHLEAERLEMIWQRRKVNDPTLEEPNFADVLYHAGKDIIEQAWKLHVDWVIVVSGVYLHGELQENFDRPRHFKIGFIFTESPYWDGAQGMWAAHVDQCWTNDRASVARLQAINPTTSYLATGYDPEVHRPRDPEPDTPRHDVVFVGAGLIERIELLEQVDWSGIDLGLYGRWPLLKDTSPLRPYLRQEATDAVVPNDRVAELYRAAKIGLNLYRTSTIMHGDAEHVGGAYSLNPRAYELAATRTFQLSEYRPEIEDVFGMEAVPYFYSPDELINQVRYYLAHPRDREQCADLAWHRVQRHSYDERARTILDQITSGVREVASVSS